MEQSEDELESPRRWNVPQWMGDDIIVERSCWMTKMLMPGSMSRNVCLLVELICF